MIKAGDTVVLERTHNDPRPVQVERISEDEGWALLMEPRGGYLIWSIGDLEPLLHEK